MSRAVNEERNEVKGEEKEGSKTSREYGGEDRVTRRQAGEETGERREGRIDG